MRHTLKCFSIMLLSIIGFSVSAFAQQLPKKTHSHEVNADSAKKYIGNLKKDAMQMKVKGGMLYRDVFDKMLSQKGVAGIRYYYAKMDDGTPTLVFVGVDSTGKDMTSGVMAEKVYPCPPYCDDATTIDK